MATTIPFPFREHHDPLKFDPKINDLIDLLIQRYERNLGDEDKAAEGYDAGYYTGHVVALADVLLEILDVPDGDWDRYIDVTEPESNLNQNGEQL